MGSEIQREEESMMWLGILLWLVMAFVFQVSIDVLLDREITITWPKMGASLALNFIVCWLFGTVISKLDALMMAITMRNKHDAH